MCVIRVLSWVLIAALLGRSASAAPINPDDPPQGRFSDDWAEVWIGDTKSGYAHSTMTRNGERIQTYTTMKLRLSRAGQNVEMGLTQETTERLDGLPIRFASTMELSTVKTVTSGTVQDGKVTIVTQQYGMERTQTFDYPSGAVMTWGGFRESLKKGFTPGTQYSLPVYAPEFRLDGPVMAKTSVGDWENFLLRGKTLRGQRVNVQMESPIGSVEMISWVDEDGRPIRSKLPVPGVADMEVITTDQATALADFVPPEIFMSTAIKAPRPIDRRTVNRIKYRLTPRNEDGPAIEIPTTAMQRVTGRNGRSADVEVVRLAMGQASSDGPASAPGAPSQANSAQAESAPAAEYSTGNLVINTDDPALIVLAKDAAGGLTKPGALADRLRQFVSTYVANKSMNIGFATASEVARTKEGDCSEHAVLLAALGRINGLPSRVVVGLAYAPFFGGQEDIFGYHMWTQFWLDGRWIDFDAALGESSCNPGRIAFATSSLKDSGLADLSLALLSTLGALQIEILEIDPPPPTP